MDGFSYVNIFATKGIEYLIVIGFFMVLIPFWLQLNKQVKVTEQLQKMLGVLTSNILQVPKGLFFSKNHTWTHLEKSGAAKVGLDDLIQHLTGKVHFSTLKHPGDVIKKGEILTEIEQNGKTLKIMAPISGTILKTNQKLKDNSELLNMDPYGKGWIYKIEPSNWIMETSAYYLADEASKWASSELDRFKDFLAESLKRHSPEPSGIVLQDGGELRDNTLTELPKEVWNDFQNEFLN